MAIEDALIYALVEAPTLVLSATLRRVFPLSHKQADYIATLILMISIIGACFLAWFLYQRR